MDFSTQVPMVKIKGKNGVYTRQNALDCVIQENRLNLYLNDRKIISTMCVINQQEAYGVGFLIGEGVIEHIDDISEIKLENNGLDVFIKANINSENLANLFQHKTLTSGCCVGVSANFQGKLIQKFISSKFSFKISSIMQNLAVFREDSALFLGTGCSHKVMIFCENEIFISEDIGRHNALDKAIGQAHLARANLKNAMLIASGRLSMEMVIKCAMSEIPLVISKSAATFLGIKSAQKLGISLIGFAREQNMNIYTHSARIVE